MFSRTLQKLSVGILLKMIVIKLRLLVFLNYIFMKVDDKMKKNVGKKHAFIFQGVGSEYQKSVNLLDEDYREMLIQHCSIVHREIGLDLYSYLFDSTINKYDKLFCDWIAIYTCDYIVSQIYANYGIKADILLGYSMGLITAMVFGKSISFESGLHMLLCIYQYPHYADRHAEAMGVIVGMTCSDVEGIIQSNNLQNFVEIASENNEHCIVISGGQNGVHKVLKIAKNEGALKVKEVTAPYAFHSHYAEGGIERLVQFVDELEVLDSMVPIISSFNQVILQNSLDLKAELVKNMSGRMYWRSSIEKIVEMGITNFVEVSLEESLSKFSKLINLECKYLTFNKFIRKTSKWDTQSDSIVAYSTY